MYLKRKNKKQLKLTAFITLGALFLLGGAGVLSTKKSSSVDTYQTFVSSKEPVIYSKQCGDDAMKVVCDAIDHAQNNIFLRIYRLTAPEIIDSLINQANSQREVTIHYEKMMRSQDFPQNDHVQLICHPVEGRKLMHQKALAIDDTQAWLGSANYTYSSFLQDSNLVIGLKSKELCQFIKEGSCGTCKIQNQNAQYFTLPGDKGEALCAVLETLKTAKKTIRIAMFALTYPQIFRELHEAKNRGVDVKILIDKGFKKIATNQIRALPGSKLSLYAKQTPHKLHHKFAIVDKKTLITGSVNWSEGGFCINSEDMIILDNLTKKQIRKLDRIWSDLEQQCAQIYPSNTTVEKEAPCKTASIIEMVQESQAA